MIAKLIKIPLNQDIINEKIGLFSELLLSATQLLMHSAIQKHIEILKRWYYYQPR